SHDDVAYLHHEVLAHGAAGVRQSVFESRTGRIQKQSWCFYSVSAHHDDFCFLLPLIPVRVKVGDASDESILAHINTGNHTVSANFSAVTNGIRNMADQGALLGSYLTALNAETTIDAVLTVAVRTFENGYRPTCTYTDAEL